MVLWRDATRADDAQPAMPAETLSIAEAPRAMATPARTWPASACRRIAMAIGPGGIAKTNPSPRPTSKAVTMALPLSPCASLLSLEGAGPAAASAPPPPQRSPERARRAPASRGLPPSRGRTVQGPRVPVVVSCRPALPGPPTGATTTPGPCPREPPGASLERGANRMPALPPGPRVPEAPSAVWLQKRVALLGFRGPLFLDSTVVAFEDGVY